MIKDGQQYPPGTRINFVSFDNQNSLTRNGKEFFCPEGRRGRAGEPGFPAKDGVKTRISQGGGKGEL
jgi:flagellar basal body rod protein FlgG